MVAALSYVPFTDQAAATRNFGTVQQSIGGTTEEVYRQVLDLAYLACYTIPISAAISTGTANSHLGALMAGSTYDVLIVGVNLRQLAGAGGATVGQLGLYRLTTAGTGGTAITPAKMDAGDAAAGATFQTLPSAKGTETTLLLSDAGIMLATVPVAGVTPYINWTWNPTLGKPPRIAAGTSNGLAIKQITAIATGTLVGTITVLEVSYS